MNRTMLRAAILISAVYGYFLIFVQFSFIELIRDVGTGHADEKVILAAMSIGGIGAGFFVAWRGVSISWFKAALIVAAIVSALAPTLCHMPFAVLIGFLAGAAVGVATVSLATLLIDWCGLICVGFGTGIGYAFCNLPWVFQSNSSQQAYIACGLAISGLLAVPRASESSDPKTGAVAQNPGFWPMVLAFTAIVWLDSAVFFIIQHVSEMKAGTWGAGHLWRNCLLHLSAAILAGFWLKHGNPKIPSFAAWALLSIASLATASSSTITLTGWIYPVGVSIYSSALIAWPAWFSNAKNRQQIGWRAASLFGIAGWFGSANGIGMAQSLQNVPIWFIAASGICVIAGIIITEHDSWRTAAVLGTMLMAYGIGNRKERNSSVNLIERGKEVYISEGCINCHSQYIRPHSGDETLWGTSANFEDIIAQKPVLIGNRRQGPDLSTIGIRRSSAWLKEHFINPRAFTPGSTMPSYAHLFEDRRGDDLVAYLSSLGLDQFANRAEQVSKWIPKKTKTGNNGAALFASHCAVCHAADARGKGLLMNSFQRPPANLVEGPFIWSSARDSQDEQVAKIIKFGIPGTDMPGHETLTDQDINTLKTHLLDLRKDHFLKSRK